MALMNLKPIMKEAMVDTGGPSAPKSKPSLFGKKKNVLPSQSNEVKPLPNLMKRLTGK